MRLAPLLLLAPLGLPAFGVSCGAPATRATAPVAAASTSTSPARRPAWVVVDPFAILREQPDDASVGMRAEVSPSKASALLDDDTAYALFLAGEERGDFVGLQTVAEGPHGYSCTYPPEALGPFAVTLWVHRSGLATVTTRRVRAQYGDGTAVTLATGVVLHGGADGLRVHVDPPLVSKVAVPADASGTSFFAQRGFDAEGAHSIGLISGSFVLAGKEWDSDVLEGYRHVYARHPTPSGPLFTMRTPCVQYEVRAKGELDEDFGLGGLGMLGGGAGSDCSHAPAGAPVYFRSGQQAGVTRWPLRLPELVDGDRACWRRALGSTSAGQETGAVRNWVELCMRLKDAVMGTCPLE
ncbi:MAG: hypothetical protein HYV09_20830 [Deltaproteobacteria bacterium]|nr:hypothetical protein [Deltaproteobacteria bacterium]